jgi:hypothetical protein
MSRLRPLLGTKQTFPPKVQRVKEGIEPGAVRNFRFIAMLAIRPNSSATKRSSSSTIGSTRAYDADPAEKLVKKGLSPSTNPSAI